MSYNEQGIRLIDDQILVKPDPVEDTFETKSSVVIYKAQTSQDEKMEKAAQTKATIVDISPDAYRDLTGESEHLRPKVGERVYMQRHAGHHFDGKDGEEYRIINEGEVIGFINF